MSSISYPSFPLRWYFNCRICGKNTYSTDSKATVCNSCDEDNSNDVELDYSICTCDLHEVIMVTGCRCGHMREQDRVRNK